MTYNFVSNIEQCLPLAASYINDNIGLIWYSHVPVAIVALLIGFFVLLKAKDQLSAKVLFALSLLFSLWVSANLVAWVSSSSVNIMFFWSLLGILDVLLFSASLYLVYSYQSNKDLPFYLKTIIAVLLVPVLVMTPTIYNLDGFDFDACYAVDNLFLSYVFGVKIFLTLIIVLISFLKVKNANSINRRQIIMFSLGTILFLATISLTGYVADSFERYDIEVYGIFSMTLFMAYLAYLIAKFKAFNVKLLGAQALIVSLVVLIGSQFLFITNTTNKVLTAIALLLTVVLGTYLIKSVKKEIEARELVEKKEKELEIANEGQSNLLHFITHQVKGYFTKSRAIFQGMVDGDFGDFPKESREIVQEGFKSATEGVDLVQNVLNASNLEKGTVKYTEDGLDIHEIVQDVISHKQEQVDAKGLNLKTNIEKGDYKTKGDPLQLKEVFKNLIDNAIRYTPKGDVDVNLSLPDGMILFYVKDSGVGITDSDMDKLFKKGSHGENSRDVNPESTGYGLYIVKEIVEAHGGRVWVESEGANKGSTFFVQLPIKN